MSFDRQARPSRPNSMVMDARRDFNIYGGTFTVNQDRENGQSSESGTGIHTLSTMIATDAIQDASERYPPPNVHRGTRTRILELLTAWINAREPKYQVFWLYGPAGVGKSAILQALAELLSWPDGRVAASFFFGKGQGKRGSGDYLFSTLAHQLALNVNGLHTYVDEVMQRNATLPTKSMGVQFRTLIIEPMKRLTRPNHIQTVIIDGLDECQGDETQESILQLIDDALTENKLPLRFLIASRPEPHIRRSFDSPTLRRISDRLALHDDFWARKDIEKYLQDGFANICRKTGFHIKMPWPGQDKIDILAQHACGQFIYAATVLKFVGQKFAHPDKQLEIVLRPHPSRAKAFSELDYLYYQILSTHPDPDTLVQVLSTILAFRSLQLPVVIEEILEMEKGEVLVVLQGLHSLLEVPGNGYNTRKSATSTPHIRILHASFRDYLLDRNRSGVFYIDETTLDAHLSTSIFSMTSHWIFKSSEIANTKLMELKCGPSELYQPSDTQHYISHHLATHLKNLHNCVELNKVAVEFKQQAVNRIVDASIVPFKILYSLIEPLSKAISDAKEQKMREELLNIRKNYVTVLHVCYKSVLSSGILGILLASLPEFGVIKEQFSISTLAYICRVERRKVSSILGGKERFMDSSSAGVRLSPHVFEFLTDKENAGVHYYDPIGPHFMLCHSIISNLLFPPRWQDIPESAVGAFQSFDLKQFFGYHLNAPYNGNILDPQHTVSLLDDLARITYDGDIKWCCPGCQHRVMLVWTAIEEVLLWLLKRKHDLCDTLAKHCAQLFDKILCQVLSLLPAEAKSDFVTSQSHIPSLLSGTFLPFTLFCKHHQFQLLPKLLSK